MVDSLRLDLLPSSRFYIPPPCFCHHVCVACVWDTSLLEEEKTYLNKRS